jgi:hypothetical protein
MNIKVRWSDIFGKVYEEDMKVLTSANYVVGHLYDNHKAMLYTCMVRDHEGQDRRVYCIVTDYSKSLSDKCWIAAGHLPTIWIAYMTEAILYKSCGGVSVDLTKEWEEMQ